MFCIYVYDVFMYCMMSDLFCCIFGPEVDWNLSYGDWAATQTHQLTTLYVAVHSCSIINCHVRVLDGLLAVHAFELLKEPLEYLRVY